MKLPYSIDKVTILPVTEALVFPPVGFVEFEEGNDGGGDCYGLYWQIGREDQEPIIFLKNHEEFLLLPEFPNLDSFLGWYNIEQGHAVDFKPSSAMSFFPDLYNKARVLTKNNKTEDAIRSLQESIEQFSEFTDSWTLLAENFYKINELDEAEYASLNSIISNYAFGYPSKKAIDQFNRINPSGKYKDHPLVKRKEGLLSGGNYINPFQINYESISESIAEFEDRSDYRSALILEHNYAHLMNFEKMEVREKYNFNSFTWANNFKNKVLTFYPDRQ
jgi:hypothetical protein